KTCAGGYLQRNYFFAVAIADTGEAVRPTTNPDAKRQAYGQYNLCVFVVNTMNVYSVIILATLLGKYVIDLISEWMNIRSLDPRLPQEFRDTYDAEKYSQSQTYTRVRTKFGIVESTFSLAVLLIFWFFGGFNALDRFVRNMGY